eukprot:c4403_g1_i1.p1 GENE.c4403_g1_i1~~c4403_g1_i1.p1  ORF type:complete len:278 (-),score=64.66 c4403_g1_i1:424-1257(-)
MRLLGVIFVFVLYVCPCASLFSPLIPVSTLHIMTFDEDLTRRVQDTISAFLSSAQPIIKQLQAQIDVDQSITNLPTDTSPSAHSLVGTTPKLSYTRQLLYSQLMSNPHATSIAMFIAPDVAMVYTREGLYVEMNAATAPIGAIVFYTIDARGNPQSYFQETSIPPEFAKQLAATQTSLLPNELSWSQIFNVTPANLGFICTAVLTKPQTTTSSSLMPTPTTTQNNQQKQPQTHPHFLELSSASTQHQHQHQQQHLRFQLPRATENHWSQQRHWQQRQ